ncbi:MAG: hypothetical protein A2275_18730 [Bacteroidetes bacterium RIFOXYA12_FULL_35_11]|nr:MAG: hypothetical protein A2X01_02225 [Bacteroidetes bacterium GWF2_35_48]OFY82141.1 MAG: hypothetical protein A2275_18730 [Bacteroidetes bacterium RIFOXYA12_FULL_35_11]OFY93155.1 MAG: hypothetical protein A2309_11090 [Bacteroidetes bacterium RIFOXYB2_FULL_35_7]OFY94709.1 MAG: hypothetical protein A2491_07520 [Bacteroidetes bacterium RIFOXYC12_FULL_35_7]HBX51595.1 hypothetical protein [Bacteroidales bacterium]
MNRGVKVQSTVIYTETWQVCKQGCLVSVILNEYKFNYIFVALFSYAVEVSHAWIAVNNSFKLQK